MILRYFWNAVVWNAIQWKQSWRYKCYRNISIIAIAFEDKVHLIFMTSSKFVGHTIWRLIIIKWARRFMHSAANKCIKPYCNVPINHSLSAGIVRAFMCTVVWCAGKFLRALISQIQVDQLWVLFLIGTEINSILYDKTAST